MCTYHFKFDMQAGPSDIMIISFGETKETGIGYAVGTSFTKAKGEKIAEPTNKKLRVAFPYNLYVTMFNTGGPGSFYLEYSYVD